MFREEVAEHYRAKGYTIRESVKVRGKSGAVHQCDMVAQSPLGNLVIAFEDAGGFEGPEMNAVKRIAHDVGATPVVAAKRLPPGVQRFAARAGVVLLDAERLRQAEVDAVPEGDEPEEPDYPPWPGTDDEGEDRDAPPPWPRTARARPRADGPMQTEDLDHVVEEWSARGHTPRTGKSTDPGFWTYPREGVEPARPRGPRTAGGQEERTSAPEPEPREPDPYAEVGDAPTAGAARAAKRPSAQATASGQAFSWLQAPQPSTQPLHVDVPASKTRGADRVTGQAAWQREARSIRPMRSAAGASGLRFWHWLVLAVAFGATAGGVVFALAVLFG